MALGWKRRDALRALGAAWLANPAMPVDRVEAQVRAICAPVARGRPLGSKCPRRPKSLTQPQSDP